MEPVRQAILRIEARTASPAGLGEIRFVRASLEVE
jgi:hypothetical protein